MKKKILALIICAIITLSTAMFCCAESRIVIDFGKENASSTVTVIDTDEKVVAEKEVGKSGKFNVTFANDSNYTVKLSSKANTAETTKKTEATKSEKTKFPLAPFIIGMIVFVGYLIVDKLGLLNKNKKENKNEQI